MPNRELIVVELTDGTVCRMVEKALDMLLRRGEIARFMRSGEWVVVGEVPLRETAWNSSFVGYERRNAV